MQAKCKDLPLKYGNLDMDSQPPLLLLRIPRPISMRVLKHQNQIPQKHFEIPFGSIIWHNPDAESFLISSILDNQSIFRQGIRKSWEERATKIEHTLIASGRLSVSIKQNTQSFDEATFQFCTEIAILEDFIS